MLAKPISKMIRKYGRTSPNNSMSRFPRAWEWGLGALDLPRIHLTKHLLDITY